MTEPQKVAEWLSGYGYQPFNVPDDIERFRGDNLPDITLQQATFFYAAFRRAELKARIEDRQHAWKMINDIRYGNISIDFTKSLCLERLSTMEVDLDMFEAQLNQNNH